MTSKIVSNRFHMIFLILVAASNLVKLTTATTVGGVVANFTLQFKAVPEDEIVTLQSAIEDDGFIHSMPVKPISLTSIDVPDRPENVTAVALSSTKVQVSWAKVIFNDPLHSIVGYTIYFKEYGEDNPWAGVAALGVDTLSSVIEYLNPYTLYTFRVLAYHSAGNGVSSNYVDARTMEGIPQAKPPSFICKQESEYEISLTWEHLDPDQWNGYMDGYKLEYVKYNENTPYLTEKFASNKRSGMISNLQPFTKYEIYLHAMTRVGLGPRAWCVESTQEGTPSVGPVITQWLPDPNHPMEAVVRWKHIPDEKIHGVLTGYLFTYGLSKVGKDTQEFPDMKSVTLDKFTTTYVLRNLIVYTETKIEIYGLTSVGKGKASQPAFVETCSCPAMVYNAWFENKPYVVNEGDGKVSGIFPTYLTNMVDFLCSSCSYYKPKMYWDRSRTGHSSVRVDEKDLKSTVADNVDIHVAMFGRAEIQTFQSDYRYVSMINSPGIAWIVRDPQAELDKAAAIMTSLASCWPAIIIIIVFSMVAGIVIFIADCQENKEDFPNDSFILGLYHGSYWAFVSMTTVGYGDKTPRSFKAQLVAICWMLMGPIINGIVIGAITTSMTSIQLEEDPKIYGSRVAAIHNSFEYNLGVRRNAKLNETGKYYLEQAEMLDDLASRHVDGILMDSLAAADIAGILQEKKMKIAKLIPEPAGWGIILSGEMVKMEDEIRSYVKFSQERIKEMIENATEGKLTIKKVETEQDSGLIDADSVEFQNFVKFGLITYVIMAIIGLAWEQIFKRIKNSKVKPYGEEHRELLEDDLATWVDEFCEEISEMINTKSTDHERELKKLFWKKGYSFGVDGWLREKTNNEEALKSKIRHHEIMSKDLGFFDKKVNKAAEKWKKGKKAAINAIGIKSIRVGSAPFSALSSESQKTLREEVIEEQETMA